ncbi:hypothetical protein FFF34_003115 [Inquilinus sp. KBS0705]|nr:hypothetical protein FFF34_003115 [Inquilinus sp. KBS0705]
MTTTYNFITTRKPTLLTLIFVFFFINSWCQAPTIGQSAGQVKSLVDYEVSSYYRAQGYHQVRMDNHAYYKNGQISEVVVCKENVPMIDLQKAGNFCTHYMMNKGRLFYIAIQYSNISIEELEAVMRKSSTQVGKYYFGDDNQTYSKVYLSQTGQATKEIHDIGLEPLPLTVKNQLTTIKTKKEEYDNSQPFDVSNAENYDSFQQQSQKVFYTRLEGMTFKKIVNVNYVTKVDPTIKAVLAYYAAISYTDGLIKHLNLGKMCSTQLLQYVTKYFNNDKQIVTDISQCDSRSAGDEFSLNRLELSQRDSIISVSFAMTYFKDGHSQDDVISTDRFKINPNHTLSIIKLASKESMQKRSEAVNNKIYDVQETDQGTYNRFKYDLKNELLRVLVNGSYRYPSFEELANRSNRSNFVPSWSLSNNYNIKWTILDNSREGRLVGNTWVAGSTGSKLVQENSLNSGNDYEYDLIKSCRLSVPSLQIDGVEIKERTVTVKNVAFDFTRGITVVKVKKGNIEFVKYAPSGTAAEKIKAKLARSDNGNYLVKYEYGNVMGDYYENINYEKLKNNGSFMGTAGAIGLGLLKL